MWYAYTNPAPQPWGKHDNEGCLQRVWSASRLFFKRDRGLKLSRSAPTVKETRWSNIELNRMLLTQGQHSSPLLWTELKNVLQLKSSNRWCAVLFYIVVYWALLDFNKPAKVSYLTGGIHTYSTRCLYRRRFPECYRIYLTFHASQLILYHASLLNVSDRFYPSHASSSFPRSISLLVKGQAAQPCRRHFKSWRKNDIYQIPTYNVLCSSPHHFITMG